MTAMRVLLIATYELGHQPHGIASPAAALRAAGHEVTCLDASRTPIAASAVDAAGLVGVSLPMHTATRLAVPLLGRIRAARPDVELCGFGVYAPPHAHVLREAGVSHVLGAECEQDLVALADALARGHAPGPFASVGPSVPRQEFRVADRAGLPPLERYARLRLPNGARRLAGYTEASRGCKHLCRHCPVVTAYRGQFRVVPVDVVMADIEQQVRAGAAHVTLGDADFFNGPRHAMAVVEALASRFTGLTYDVTIKVEHLVRHAGLLPRLRDTGCLFVTSAVESFDDQVLARLEKGHTPADVERAVGACRDAGLTLAPTFVAFTPWTTLDTYRDMLGRIETLDLVTHVAPIQLALRLLVPAGSRLLELDELRARVGPFDATRLAYPWVHADPAVDALQRDVEALVAGKAGAARHLVFAEVAALAHVYAGVTERLATDRPARASIPYLDEPWYC
jgi:radical SAM superfamily enzyme YgiQ (UPF0313 family)